MYFLSIVNVKFDQNRDHAVMYICIVLLLKFSGKINTQTIIAKFLEWTAKYPKIFVLWFGPFDPKVVLNHPDTIKKVLKTAGQYV